MSVAARIELPYRIRFDECGPGGSLRSSGYLRYAQDIARVHSERGGFGRDWYGQRGLTWLIRATELDVLDHAGYGDELVVSTEVVGFRRVWARRRSEFALAGGERRVASAVIDWVLLGPRGGPVRVPAEITGLFGAGVHGTFTPLRVDLPPAPADAAALPLEVRRSDLDPMGHVNNAAYIDYIEAFAAATDRWPALGGVPRRYRLEFAASAEPNMMLTARGWDAERGLCYLLSTRDGGALLRARVETDPVLWVGG